MQSILTHSARKDIDLRRKVTSDKLVARFVS
jgi:hypothetical protein